MESSDESFLWTDASNDCNSDSKMARDENYDNESESGLSYKKKLQMKLFDTKEENSLEEGIKRKKPKKRKHNDIDSTDLDEPKRKHIKSEPESDLDKHKTNKSQILHNDNTLNDEDFLNYKVKEEQMSSEKTSPKAKKKKKHHKEADSHDNPESNDYSSQALNNISTTNGFNESYVKEEDAESNRPKKKKAKKKKDKEYNESRVMEEGNVTEQTVQDNTMDATILDKLCKMECKTRISLENNVLHEDSQSFVDNEDEGEISRINCSHLNTTTVKELKGVSQNGDGNDKMLSCGGKLPKRVSKIADRITFEEETSEFDNDSQIYSKNETFTQYSAKFQKYLKSNKHLIQVSPSIVNDCIITDEDEVWILKCPSDVDVKNLKGSSLVIDTKCKFKVESQTYVGFKDGNTNNTTIVTIDGSKPVIKNIPLSGLIHLHKRIPKPNYVEDNNVVNNQTNFIPLPDTKCRHPLFGVNYKHAIKVPKHVAERLHGSGSDMIQNDTSDKTKRVKKRRKIKANLSDIETETKTEEERRPKKKKRKRSRDSATPPKSKRRKHDPECAETWDSEKAIEQQLFNF